jgi:galactokinase
MRDNLKESFMQVFQTDSTPRVFFAPGRVNLIGEHTDYNGGHVLPCALSTGTYMAIVPREDLTIRLYSENFSDVGVETFDVQETYTLGQTWTNYVKGVMQLAASHGLKVKSGFDAYVVGNIPNGAGLSSSASIEMVALTALNALNEWEAEPLVLVKIAQQAENQFIGVNCGIMDQFIIGLGKENHAVLLDTNTLAYEYATLELGEYSLLIANTNKQRGLADSKYNERYDECQRALKILQEVYPIRHLGQLSEEEFDLAANRLEDPILYKRAKHAVYENQRTIQAHKALNQNDLITFGELMNASHHSLKEDYEVSGAELDTLVEETQKVPGVIGSRMTGAGFGGCTVTLVRRDALDDVIRLVGPIYKERIGYAADFYSVSVGSGAKELV